MRTWINLIPAVLLAVPFTWPSLRAEDTPDQKIKKLQDDVAQIREDLESLRKEVKNSSARGARVAEDLQEIKNILHDMSRQAVISRQAAYDPRGLAPSGPPISPLPATGTITLHNVYLAPATVRINGESYFVGANQTREVRNFPAGPFQYSVDVEGFGMVLPPRTETLRPPGYVIRIFPLMPQ